MPICDPRSQSTSRHFVPCGHTWILTSGHNGLMKGQIQGDRLRELREEAGEKQVETAAAAEVTAGYISKLESGKKQTRLETLLLLCRHFNVSPDYLLGWSDDRLPREALQPLENLHERALLAAYRRLPDDVRGSVEKIIRAVRAPSPPTTPRRKRDNGP